jgi:hypothetical protein
VERPISHPRDRSFLARLAHCESGTSDVEYVLLTALVVLPLLVVPPLLIKGNVWVFERISGWMSLPYP